MGKETIRGKKFGKLLAKSRVGNNSRLCECDCGNEVVVSENMLKKKCVYSCGCVEYDAEYFVGFKCGDLEVVSFAGYDDYSALIYECVCSCGNVIKAMMQNITSCNYKDCGCKSEVRLPNIKESIIGNRFGRLVVERVVKDEHGHHIYECQCDCGNKKMVRRTLLTRGEIKSCGCLLVDTSRERMTTHGKSHKSKLYGVWKAMKQRCFDKNYSQYKDYGGRGITVCDEWRYDYELFEKWSLENGYAEGLTLDRIDPNGPYEPRNCRWVTKKVQNSNKRYHVYVNYNGEKRKLVELCEEIGFSYCVAKQRRLAGWPDEMLFKDVGFEYVRMRDNTAMTVVYNGKRMRVKDVCKEIGFDYVLAKQRRRAGWSDEELFLPKGYKRKKVC